MSTPSYPTTFRNFQLHQPQRLMKQCSSHYITIRGGLTGHRPEGLWRRLRCFVAGCGRRTQTGCRRAVNEKFLKIGWSWTPRVIMETHAAECVKKAAPSDGGALLFHRSCLFNHDGRSGPLHYLPVSPGCQCPAPVYRHSRCLQAGSPDRLGSAIRLRPSWTSR